MSRRCPDCATQLDGSPRFCPDCGTRLDPGEVTAPAPPPESGSWRSPSSEGGRFVTGQRLGDRYRIVGRLGQGGMGEVYRADDVELEQSVALKFLSERLAGDERALSRLRGEVRLARSVSHANVCRVYDLGQAEGHVFISMEYIDGEDLADALRRMGRPSREKAAELARQICLGLAAAHEVGVLHRDLKPANIMIDGRGRARITDFGLARLAEAHEDRATLAGTPAYMAPEQLSEGRVSIQSDIFSLGLVLHELFTGRRVVDADSIEDVRAIHASGSSTSSLTNLDPDVERVIARCLDPEPGSRPRSVYDVLAALPGGDPLAAAIAAGETPSPDLVACARDTRQVRPRTVLFLVLWVLGFIVIKFSILGSLTLFPERAISELSVVAQEIATRELGVSELPQHDVSGVFRNPRFPNEGVRPYVAWRRWSPVPLESSNYHEPWDIRLNSPPHTLPGSVAVVIDDTGFLVEASVIVPPVLHEPSAEVDLDRLIERAGIDPDTVRTESTDPSTLDPPFEVQCDRAMVWRDRASGDPLARAGMYAGRIVAFQRIGHAPMLPLLPRSGGDAMPIILGFATVVVILVALANLRLGRGDRRGALRVAAVVLIAYALIEASAFDLDESLLRQIADLFQGSHGAHAFLHAVQAGMIYLAFEPIARRVWPRLLVGWVRLFEGRFRDPRVGIEVLMGLAAGCGLGYVGAAFISILFIFFSESPEEIGILAPEQLRTFIGPASTVTQTLETLSGSLFWTMYMVAVTGTGYVLTRRPWAGLAAPAVTWALVFALGSWSNPSPGAPPPYMAAVLGLLLGAFIATVFVRCGLVSVLTFIWVVMFFVGRRLTSDLSSWHAPHTVFGILTVVLVLAYGAWAALAKTESRVIRA